jgi:hypothetical protein
MQKGTCCTSWAPVDEGSSARTGRGFRIAVVPLASTDRSGSRAERPILLAQASRRLGAAELQDKTNQYVDVEPPAGSFEAIQEDLREALRDLYSCGSSYVSILRSSPSSDPRVASDRTEAVSVIRSRIGLRTRQDRSPRYSHTPITTPVTGWSASNHCAVIAVRSACLRVGGRPQAQAVRTYCPIAVRRFVSLRRPHSRDPRDRHDITSGVKWGSNDLGQAKNVMKAPEMLGHMWRRGASNP